MKNHSGVHATPLYKDLAGELSKRLERGDYPQGSTLPRELDLCAEFGVSRNTVRGALAELAAQGMIRRVKRLGTIVESVRPSSALSLDMGAMEGLKRYVQRTQLKVISQRSANLPAYLAEIVGVHRARGWVLMRGVRFYENSAQPVAAIDFYLSEKYKDVAPYYGKAEGMIYELVESRFNVQIEKFDVQIQASTVGKRWAATLECVASTPAINMIEIVYAQNNDLVEVGSMVIPQKRMSLAYSVMAPRNNVRRIPIF